MRKLILYSTFYSLIFFLTGCAGLNPKTPEATDGRGAALAITVDIDSRTTILNVEKINLETILFIKIENTDDFLKKPKFNGSNYIKESLLLSGFQMGSRDSFLLDIKPGVYAAVGAIGVGANTQQDFHIYFPKELILSSITKVRPNTMSYMGKYKLEKVSGMNQMNNPDDLQEYFHKINMFGRSNQYIERAPRFAQQYMGSQFHSPKLTKADSGDEKKRVFLKSQSGNFKKTVWENTIKNSLGESHFGSDDIRASEKIFFEELIEKYKESSDPSNFQFVYKNRPQSESELMYYVNNLNSTEIRDRIFILKTIFSDRITDLRVFEIIDKKILDTYTKDNIDDQQEEELSWLCKALASSGKMEYKETIYQVYETSKSRKVKGHAKRSLSILESNAKSNYKKIKIN